MLSPLLNSLSSLLNTYLTLDPDSKERLQKLEGNVVTIVLLPFNLSFQCIFSDTKVKLHEGVDLPANTTLSGTPLQLSGVALSKRARHRFFAEDVRIEGSAEVGQQVMQLFDELHIDWEEYSSQLIGDVPAYHLGRSVKKVKNFIQHSITALSQNINDYVHEEIAVSPPKEALLDFYQEVDDLRMDVDRVAAKVRQLQLNLLQDHEAST